jgi:hypothetical protein
MRLVRLHYRLRDVPGGKKGDRRQADSRGNHEKIEHTLVPREQEQQEERGVCAHEEGTDGQPDPDQPLAENHYQNLQLADQG